LAPIFLNDPTLLNIDGNTNGVNTFTGLDIGNLTSGVINGENLLRGANFACFYKLRLSGRGWWRFASLIANAPGYRTLQIALTEELPNATGAGLIQLGGTVRQVINAIFDKLIKGSADVSDCPKFSYTDLHTQTHFCGVRQQPGAIY
jgi:hypothetical protein